jgi:hypothetical protein
MAENSFLPIASKLTKPYIKCTSPPTLDVRKKEVEYGSQIYFVNSPEGISLLQRVLEENATRA